MERRSFAKNLYAYLARFISITTIGRTFRLQLKIDVFMFGSKLTLELKHLKTGFYNMFSALQ